MNGLTLESSGAPLVKGSSSHLRDVFENLIQNAMQAMPSSGTLTVEASLTEEAIGRHASQIEIRISDTGAGVPPENRDRIFDFGFTTKLSEESTHFGFGLWLAQSIVKFHKGSIRLLDSDAGRGATFVVTLPLATSDVQVLAGFHDESVQA